MGKLLLGLILVLNFCNPLYASDYGSPEFEHARFVPFAEGAVMKIYIPFTVCENDTPEQAAKALVQQLEESGVDVATLQLLPSAPSHLRLQFKEIKNMIAQIMRGETIHPAAVSQEILVAQAASASIVNTPQPALCADLSHKGRGKIGEAVGRPLPQVGEAILMEKSTEGRVRGNTQDDASYLANHDGDGPSSGHGGGSDMHKSKFIAPLIETIVAKVPSVQTISYPLQEEEMPGKRVPLIMRDHLLKTQQAVEENGNILKTTTCKIIRMPVPSLGFLYVMFLLTILANFCGRYLSPRSLVFARLKD